SVFRIRWSHESRRLRRASLSVFPSRSRSETCTAPHALESPEQGCLLLSLLPESERARTHSWRPTRWSAPWDHLPSLLEETYQSLPGSASRRKVSDSSVILR